MSWAIVSYGQNGMPVSGIYMMMYTKIKQKIFLKKANAPFVLLKETSEIALQVYES